MEEQLAHDIHLIYIQSMILTSVSEILVVKIKIASRAERKGETGRRKREWKNSFILTPQSLTRSSMPIHFLELASVSPNGMTRAHTHKLGSIHLTVKALQSCLSTHRHTLGPVGWEWGNGRQQLGGPMLHYTNCSTPEASPCPILTPSAFTWIHVGVFLCVYVCVCCLHHQGNLSSCPMFPTWQCELSVTCCWLCNTSSAFFYQPITAPVQNGKLYHLNHKLMKSTSSLVMPGVSAQTVNRSGQAWRSPLEFRRRRQKCQAWDRPPWWLWLASIIKSLFWLTWIGKFLTCQLMNSEYV